MAGTYKVDASFILIAFNGSEAGHAASTRRLAFLQERAAPIKVLGRRNTAERRSG